MPRPVLLIPAIGVIFVGIDVVQVNHSNPMDPSLRIQASGSILWIQSQLFSLLNYVLIQTIRNNLHKRGKV